MDARYTRNLPALSAEECALLQTKKVLIVGCGGIGGHLIDLLARIGVGHMRLVDGDVFEATNLNRQLLCEQSLLGSSKALAAEDRVKRINDTIAVETIAQPMTSENVNALLDECDVVLDALDSIESRRILAKAASQAGIPYVYGAINGWVAQAAIILPEENTIDLLYPPTAKLTDKSVLSFTPACCASMQASLCVKLLVGRPYQSRVLYYADLLNMEFETIPLAL